MTRARWILLACWLAFILYAYPGYMMSGAGDQLVDSRTGSFTDWHSPMMTEVWRIIGRFVSGPAGMLFAQSLLLLLGTYHLSRRVMSDRAAAITAGVVLLLPPLIATTALISAEAQLAGFLVAGAAALTSQHLRIRIVGLGLMVIACGMRDGAVFAAAPIVIASFRVHDRHARWQRLAIATVAWGAVALLACGLDRWMIDWDSGKPEVAIANAEIAGTLPYTGALDPELRARLAAAPHAAETPEDRDALLAARRALVHADREAYYSWRWQLFRRELGLQDVHWKPLYLDFVGHDEDRAVLSHAAWHSLTQRTLIWPVRLLSRTLLFKPYVYAVLAIILLPFALIRRRIGPAVLLASGLCYEGSLMFSITRAEYQDSHWMIVATVLAIAWLLKVRDERVLDEAPIVVAQHDHG